MATRLGMPSPVLVEIVRGKEGLGGGGSWGRPIMSCREWEAQFRTITMPIKVNSASGDFRLEDRATANNKALDSPERPQDWRASL